ncbi:unnamed protein product, partial [Didymodactylos carnosus]
VRGRDRTRATTQAPPPRQNINQNSVNFSIHDLSLHDDRPARTTITGVMPDATDRYNDFLDLGFELYHHMHQMMDQI